MRGDIGPGCDGSAVTFFLVLVPRLALRQTFAMGPAAVLFLLLLTLGTSEAKRAAGEASAGQELGVGREGRTNPKCFSVCV